MLVSTVLMTLTAAVGLHALPAADCLKGRVGSSSGYPPVPVYGAAAVHYPPVPPYPGAVVFQPESHLPVRQQANTHPPAAPGPEPAQQLVQLGTHQFFFGDVNQKVTWQEARQQCESRGMQLADIETEEENTLLHAHIKRAFERRHWGFWLGGTDAGHEGTWQWISSGQPLGYSGWDDDQPGGGEAENCLIIHRSDGAWNDFDCARTFAFICKKHGGPPGGQGTDNGNLQSLVPPAAQAPQKVKEQPSDIKKQSASGLELIQLGNNQYYFSNRDNKVNWADANKFCTSHGMRLADINSAEENEIVNSRVKKLYERSFWGAWLGATDAGHEGTWKWASSDQPLSYDNFDDEQPGGGDKENCLLMHRSDARWNDFNCDRQFIFICKA